MVRPCGENDRDAKRVYVGECAGSRSVGRPRNRWIDNVKGCLKRRGRVQVTRVCEGECVGRRPRDELLT